MLQDLTISVQNVAVIIIILFLISVGILTYFSSVFIETKPYNEIHLNRVRFSVQNFYSRIEDDLIEQNIRGISIYRYTRKEGGLFSQRREYLRIKYRELFIEVSAIPYGSGISIFCRRGMLAYVKRILESTSFLDTVIKDIFFTQTLFRLDTEQTFKATVDNVIKDSINRITSNYLTRTGIQFGE